MSDAGNKLNICVFAPEIHDTISQDVINGILSKAQILGVNVSIIAAGGVNLENRIINEDAKLYKDILKFNLFDGIIALTGSFSNHATSDEVINFFEFIPENFPMVNLSAKIPGYPALLIDNKTPIKEITDHLIKDHNKKRVAFIKGPEGHIEAEERFQGYLESLKDNGIDFNEDIIYQGNFSPHAGSVAVKKMLENSSTLPDAIICVDDDTALGVLSELKRNGINPALDKVAITGFDNMDYTKSMIPSLTTVDQTFISQGVKAVETLVKLIKSGSEEDVYYAPKVIYRDSCGCNSDKLYNEASFDEKGSMDHIYNSLEEAQIENLESHIDEIISSVYKFVEDPNHNFYKTIDKYLDMYSYRGYSLKVISDILSHMNRLVIPILESDRLLKYLQIIESIESKIIDSITHEKIRDYRSFSEQSSELDAILMQLATCYTYNELIEALERNFFYLGIKKFSFNFFGEHSPMIRDLEGRNLEKDDSLNRSLKNYCTLYLPVFTKRTYGYCKLKIIQNSFHIAEVLSFQISRTLYLIELLNDLNDKIFELESSYRDLRATKEMLLESEQLANLGGLVAGFTHEINSPIGIGVTATSHLQDQVNHISSLYKKNELKKSDLENFIKLTDESVNIVMSNLNRAATLIQGFKQIAVDQASEILRSFEFGGYLKEIVHSLSPVLKQTKHKIDVSVEEAIIIDSYPGAISQIITNLIQNSLKHGFEFKDEGLITLKGYKKDKNLVIEYLDNGCGIKKENVEKIFESYYSTKIGKGGSGLGLAIVKELVTDKLKGNITCSSSEGEGIKFIIQCPLDVTD